jgi:hypothetical protein
LEGLPAASEARRSPFLAAASRGAAGPAHCKLVDSRLRLMLVSSTANKRRQIYLENDEIYMDGGMN